MGRTQEESLFPYERKLEIKGKDFLDKMVMKGRKTSFNLSLRPNELGIPYTAISNYDILSYSFNLYGIINSLTYSNKIFGPHAIDCYSINIGHCNFPISQKFFF